MREYKMLTVKITDLKNKKSDTEEKILTLFQKYLNKPLISMEAATRHPLQSLADTITIKEQWKETRKPKVVLTWGPHIKPIPHAVANSFAEWMNAQDVDFVITHPEGLDLDPAFVESENRAIRAEIEAENEELVRLKKPLKKIPEFVSRSQLTDAAIAAAKARFEALLPFA